MIPVFQDVFTPGYGNCMAACVASILELPLQDVPNFRAQEEDDPQHRSLTWHLQQFLAPRGMCYVAMDVADVKLIWQCLTTYCIFVVPSQRNPGGLHAVVGFWEEISYDSSVYRIVHDPRRDNAPYNPQDVIRCGFFINNGRGPHAF